jgi:ATP-dependent Clp protease adapter protein ClpS
VAGEKLALWQRIARSVGIGVYRLDDLTRYESKLAEDGRYVFVLNDDVSPMNLVARWIERTFEVDTKTAAARMVAVHRHGFVPFGPYAPTEALLRIERGQRFARWFGLSSLRFQVEPPAIASRREPASSD